MLELRRAQDHDRPNSWHTFSLPDYHDPKPVQFRASRVINDDIVEPAGGFGTRGHRDMEMVSYVLDGADGSVTIHANARMFVVLLDGEERVEHSVASDRYFTFRSRVAR